VVSDEPVVTQGVAQMFGVMTVMRDRQILDGMYLRFFEPWPVEWNPPRRNKTDRRA
jgi:hypothetical protein